jgi:hypothetical protein
MVSSQTVTQQQQEQQQEEGWQLQQEWQPS